MKVTLWQHFKTSFIVLVSLTLVTGVLYPVGMTLVTQLLFPHEANGSLVMRDGAPIGSEHIGQPFSRPRYFWGRLSATAHVPFDAAASSGSNAGPLNPVITEHAKVRLDALRRHDPDVGPVPVDLVTASASGLDPHVSPAAAEVQVKRVATARRMPEELVRSIVAEQTEPRQFGILGEPRVNVLRLNLALDRLTQSR